MAENILEIPVRIGIPSGVGSVTDVIDSPVYATGVGLMLYGAEEYLTEKGFGNGNMLTGFTTKLKGWIEEVFK